MYCPACGVENGPAESRFCRACGTDLRAVSQAFTKSVPMKLASTLDAYLENRFQRNLSNGVLNLVAFVALMLVGGWHLFTGWLLLGGCLLGLGVLALLLGLWDIWIYRRNLPPIAKPRTLSNIAKTDEMTEAPSPLSVTEGTTRTLPGTIRQTEVRRT